MGIKESEKFYRSIIDGDYDSRLKKSLGNIKAACDEREKQGGRIYVGRVGKTCQDKFGGPTPQSIRNQPGTLRKYVELRAAEQMLPRARGSKEVGLKISDPKIRAYVLLLEEQVRDHEALIGTLKRLLKGIAPVEIDKLIAEAFSGGTLLTLPPVPNGVGNNGTDGGRLGETARRALEKVTSEDHLRQFGLSLYKGRVIGPTALQLLDKDEYQSLLDLLAARGRA